MAKTFDHKTSAGEFDGQLPFVFSAAVNLLTTSPVGLVPPCDCTLVGAHFDLAVLPGTGNAHVQVGVTGDLDRALDAVMLTTGNGGVVGYQNLSRLIAAGDATSPHFSQGETILVNSDSGATSTGSGFLTLVFMPSRA